MDIQNEYQFNIGSYHRDNIQQSARRSRKRISTENKNEYMEKLYTRASQDVNPIYFKNLIQSRFYRSRQNTFFYPVGEREIVVLIKNKYPDNGLYSMIHSSLSYWKRTYFEWYVMMLERNIDLTMAIYGSEYLRIVNHIYSENQTVRWSFKRLLAIWLRRKSFKKQIGYETDLVTQESITADNKIEVLCLKSRCVYCFSGNTLIKSICSNLETQVNGISLVTFPKNPYTNLRFSYGQMFHIYNECLKWCSKKSKPFPLTLAMYRDSMFGIRTFANMHRLYLQRNAAVQYIKNDDVDSTFLLDTINEFLLNNESTIRRITNIDVSFYYNSHSFRKWLMIDTGNSIHKQWRSFISDYWFYTQTDTYPREHWISFESIVYDFQSLIQISKPYLVFPTKRKS